MKRLEKFVSLHPYFRIRPGKKKAFLALLAAFNRRMARETALFAEFSISGDEVFCREAYPDAETALAHVANVQSLLARAAKLSDVTRFEIHGPATELRKMRKSLPAGKATWFVLTL